jgi:hypothetical protein
MAECDWIVLCDYAFVAVPSKVSLIGIFDVIYAHDVPVMHDRAFVAFTIIGEPGELVAVTLEIIGPTGKTIATAKQAATLPDSGGGQVMIEVRGLPLSDFGRHAIQVDLGDGVPKSAWFTLTRVPKAEAHD